MRFVVYLAGVSLLALVVSGCWNTNKASSPEATGAIPPMPGGPGDATTTPQQPDDGGPLPAGRKVFKSSGCAMCHSIGDSPIASWIPGPELSHVGKDHDADWIAAHIRDPETHEKKSRMPKFPEAKINAADLKTLADYLAS